MEHRPPRRHHLRRSQRIDGFRREALQAGDAVLIRRLMAESNPPKTGGGCLSKLLLLALLLVAGALGTAIYYVTQPQDLTDLGGYQPGGKTAQGRDLKAVLKSSIERGYPLTLSETDINNWLGNTLIPKQDGLLGTEAKFDRVWVRLQEGQAEIIMARTLMGKSFTVSMYVQLEEMEDDKGKLLDVRPHGGPYHPDFPHPPQGGRFGKLVVPQGFLHLVLPAYRKLAEAFPEEIELAFTKMHRIRIEKGQMILDPREPLGSGIPDTF